MPGQPPLMPASGYHTCCLFTNTSLDLVAGTGLVVQLSNTITCTKDQYFYQVYYDANNCSNTGSIQINVLCGKGNLYIPNTFSPNGDGSNDFFYPRGTGLERVKFLRIFNRWGEVVFEKKDFPVNNAASGWDGRFKGQKPKADVYIFQAEVFCENGELIQLNGNIALIL
jgi:gliding motility-associated-like protein